MTFIKMENSELATQQRRGVWHSFECAMSRHCLTNQEVAASLEVSWQAVSKWRNGRTNPSRFNLARLSELLGVRAEDLFADMPVRTRRGTVRGRGGRPRKIAA